MGGTVNRRGFLGTALALGGGVRLAPRGLFAAEAAKGAPNCEKLGWRFGITAYTFRHLALVEAAEQVAALGLRYIEGFTWQKLSARKPNVVTNETMSADDRKEAKARLADLGVQLVSCYCQAMAQEAACRKLFDWAKEMGMEILVAEPPANAYEMLDKLLGEYQLSLAVHNHPKPSGYWSPEVFLKAAEGRTRRIGVCGDTGHWARSGIKPADALRQLEGRIVSLHIKDIAKFDDPKCPCVTFGAGEGDLAGVAREIRRQGIKPLITIEHEVNAPTVADVAACVAYFDKVAGE
ncbi:MAG TPA: sugar phosphate isomerase/epimerase [Planctomycetota bacterium]|nr:sugar phosphate isomerase/epimerase [Planctomycetota bacterium]HRR80380.1 sugar phosphate isomerase/epimerase [Planctomycetota bacterium]HRT95867.1 sugar phosphate isomerase/epimerase [Planctomycetota bacterium]